jgi:hypothetical protein
MGTVTIACKLPNGLILRVFDMVESDELVLGGGIRKKKEANAWGKTVTIKGNSIPMNKMNEIQFSHGYALTPDVDEDFWNLWYEQNKTSAIVRNGLIFASDKKLNVSAFTKEHEKLASGFERLSMSGTGDPRAPKAPLNVKPVSGDPDRMAQRS